MTKQNNGWLCKTVAYEAVYGLDVSVDLVPPVAVREVPGMLAVLAVTTVVMNADSVATFCGSSRKPGITVAVFAKPVEHLDKARPLAIWLPELDMDVVAVCPSQNLLLVM